MSRGQGVTTRELANAAKTMENSCWWHLRPVEGSECYNKSAPTGGVLKLNPTNSTETERRERRVVEDEVNPR